MALLLRFATQSKKYNTAGVFRVKLTVTNRVGCVDTISKLITVNPQPIADFTYNTPCENEVVNFTSTGNANVTYLWTLAAGQTSTLQDPSYTYNTGGPKTVSLITVTDLGCRDTATKTVNVLTKPTVSITPNTTICAGTSIQLIAAGGAQYSWRNDSTLTSTTLANPTATPIQNTTYVVTVTAANGCFRSDSVRISLQAPPPVEAGPDTSVCFNLGSFRDSVRLQASGALSYVWSPTTGVSNPTIANPTVRPLINTTYFVTGRDVNGCFATDSVRVYFLDPSLNLIVEDIQPICINDTISLTILEQGAGSYAWSPPIGMSNPSSNTPIFFPRNTTTYIFTVQNYCYQKQDTVTIIVNPLPPVTTQKIDSVCIGDSVILRVSGAQSYAWDTNPTLSDTSIANPFAFPTTPTTYTVLGIDANGCKNKDSVRVLVFFPPLTDVLPDTAFICQGDPVTLQAVGGVRYLWNADPSLSSITISDPIATPLDTTTYFVKITNIHNCSTNDTITINVQHPVIAVTQSPYDFCTGKSIQLNASGGFYYQWTPPISLSNANISNPTASPSSSVVYVVNVSNDCFSDTATVVLTIRPLPIIDAGMDTLIYRNTEATLQGVSNVSNNYWAPGLYIKNPLDLNSTASPLKTSKYYLYAISDYGCVSVDSVLITVDPKIQLFIPTAFSPNNDGENDIFRIVPPTLNIAQLEEFAIYNRWGQKVFSTHDINEGWNGTFNNRSQDVGVYVWYIKAITYDGEPVFKKGNVTLVK
jgi:gliding motility-associated-like protein